MSFPSTTIKICGIGSQEDLQAAHAAGADMVGFVRATGSPRMLDRERAQELTSLAPDTLQTVGVYVDPTTEEPAALPTNWIQLHGSESPEEVTRIARHAANARVIRGFHFQEDACHLWDQHQDVDLLLIDGPRAGSGQTFDHEQLIDIMEGLKTPVIVAGGLNPDTVHEVVQRVRPFGVDVSSGVESAPGQKDNALIAAFCQAVRSAEK